MKISDKILLDREGLEQEGAITIVAFGDSITHGALSGTFNYESVYHNRLKQKLNAFRDYIPVNVINAGIGGATAKSSICRLERQVLAHKPDLVIVCFGLNDINGTLQEYLSSLKTIFLACREACEVIFLTPNMLNTYVAQDTPKKHLDYAKVTAQYQTGGKMDLYINSAIQLAKELDIEVCDCYSEWKKLSEKEDTTQLLANRINHPREDMHELFADMLFKTICKNITSSPSSDSAMYQQERS